MDSDDPFANNNSDRTIIRPLPGGRGRSHPPQPAADIPPTPQHEYRSPAPPRSPAQDFAPQDGVLPPASLQIQGSGLNPLLDTASSLLMVAAQQRQTLSQTNVNGLRDQMIRQLRMFEDQARSRGIDQETILTSRYLLCTILDESVLSTPWGSESDWSSQSLLSTFHNENWGGEKFFQILDHLIQQPSQNLDILELVYICLSFGFQGKYSVSDRGISSLQEIQDKLYRTLAMQRGDFERELSPHWHGAPNKKSALVKYVPLWVVGALAGVLLLVVYAGFRLIVSSSTSPIYEEIDQLQISQLQNVQTIAADTNNRE